MQLQGSTPQPDPGGRLFFFGVFALLVVLTMLVIQPFLSTIGLAIILVVVLQPLYRWFLNRRWINGRKVWALSLTLLGALIVVLIPLYAFLTIAFSQGQLLFNALAMPASELSIEALLEQFEELLRQLIGNAITLDLAGLADNLRTLARSAAIWLGNMAVNLGLSIPALFARLTVLLLLLILWLPGHRANVDQIVALSPLPQEVTRLYLQKVNAMLNAMFRGVFIISFAQGASMGIFLFLAGVPFALFLTVLSMFLAILPVIGVFLVAFPVGIILILSGQIWPGLLVIVGYLLVVANVDTVLRPMLVPQEAYLNPALVLLSVLGGLQLMGLLGAFYGPVIMILLVTTLEVYAEYYAGAKPGTASSDGATQPELARPPEQ